MTTPSINKIPTWMIVIAAIVIPGSGHVILGKPMRGLLLLFWMFVFGYITFQLSGENISFIGRYSGGIAIWVLTILEAYRFAKKRNKKD